MAVVKFFRILPDYLVAKEDEDFALALFCCNSSVTPIIWPLQDLSNFITLLSPKPSDIFEEYYSDALIGRSASKYGTEY